MAALLSPARPRVLVAVRDRPGRDRLARILSGWRADFVLTGDEVRGSVATRPYDSVVLGVHFDESNAFDALQDVLAARPACPVVCVRVAPFSHPLTERSFGAFRTACSALGACEVLDLLHFPDDAAGNSRVRDMLARLIEAPD
jgi:hypothetical protein